MNGVRPGLVNGPPQQNMLAMTNQSFMQSQQNPPMALLGGQPQPGQRFSLQPQQPLQPQASQQRHLLMNRPQQQFPMQHQADQIRRVSSQSHLQAAGMRQQPSQQQQAQLRMAMSNPDFMRQQQTGNILRTPSNGPVMNSLGGTGPLIQNPFQPQPPPQLSSSPRPPNANPTRARLTPPDNPMFFGNGPRPGQPTSYPFAANSANSNPASTPPMQMSDLAQGGSPGAIVHSQGGTPTRPISGGFLTTPAQAFDLMNNGGGDPGFGGMPPPSGVPPRPPSHGTTPHQAMHLQQQQQQAQQAQQHQHNLQHHQQVPHQHTLSQHQQQAMNLQIQSQNQRLQEAQAQHLQQQQHSLSHSSNLSMSMVVDNVHGHPMHQMGATSLNPMGSLLPMQPPSAQQPQAMMNMGMPGRPASQTGNGNNIMSMVPVGGAGRNTPRSGQMSLPPNTSNNGGGAGPSNQAHTPRSAMSTPVPSASSLPTPTLANAHTNANNSSPANANAASNGGSNALGTPSGPLTSTGRIPGAPTHGAMPMPLPSNSIHGPHGPHNPHAPPQQHTPHQQSQNVHQNHHPGQNPAQHPNPGQGPHGHPGMHVPGPAGMLPIAPRPPSASAMMGVTPHPHGMPHQHPHTSHGPPPHQQQQHGAHPHLQHQLGSHQPHQPPGQPGHTQQHQQQQPGAQGPAPGPGPMQGIIRTQIGPAIPIPGASTGAGPGSINGGPGGPAGMGGAGGSAPGAQGGIPVGATVGGAPGAGTVGAVPSAVGAAGVSAGGMAVGSGQGLIRLLQFSGILAGDTKKKLQLSWWNDLVKEYFTPKAIMKLTLWRDSQQNEAKPFEIGVPILPRFFLVTTQSGVKSMSLSLDGARERVFGAGHSVVECVAAVWTYRYTNGYTVTLRGPLTVHVIITTADSPSTGRDHVGPTSGTSTLMGPNGQRIVQTLKFEDFQFDANTHDKHVQADAILGPRTGLALPSTPGTAAMDTTPIPPMQIVPISVSLPATTSISQAQAQINYQRRQEQHQAELDAEEERKWEEPRIVIDHATMPGEPVNAFGIPQATMRCLELAESVSSMAELIEYAKETTLGPLDALKKYATKLRETNAIGVTPIQPSQPGLPLPLPNPTTSSTPNPAAATLGSSNSFTPSSSSSHPPPPGPSPSVTLYSSAPSSVTNPGSSMNSPRDSSSLTGSPDKQAKTIPQQQGGQGQTPAQGSTSSPAISANNTPAMANASLKRKQVGGDAASSSPVAGHQANPQQDGSGSGNPGGATGTKRGPRKRNRTNTTGGP